MFFLKTVTPLFDKETYAREATQKIVAALLKEKKIQSKDELQSFVKTELPLLSSLIPEKVPGSLVYYMLCVSRQDAFKFFFELTTKFLVPGKKLTAQLLFASDFRFEGLSDELLTAAELLVAIEDVADIAIIKQQKPVIESQMRLGIVSAYHALRILEMKDLLQDEKTLLIHDRMTALARRARFDIHLIAEMQQFLVTTAESFRSRRTLIHLNRIICLLYLFKKHMQEERAKDPSGRYCFVKVMRGQVKSDEKSAPVIGIVLALNLISQQEVFEELNLRAAVEGLLPHLRVKRGSYFSSFTGQSELKFLYIEFTKPQDAAFTHDEVKKLRKQLPESVVSQVEELLHPIFMPHNEEELIRNIVTLSKQLRFVRDIPQVIITFNEHTGSELSFTVILLRLLKKNDLPVEKLFAERGVEFVKERIKTAGMVRKKYPKEATVFHLRIKKKAFIRQDRSIDLYKARQAILEEIVAAIGPVRDYNGGMLSKHREAFLLLQELLGPLAIEKEFLLENFFYGITPVIMKNLLEPKVLKNWFLIFLEALREDTPEKWIEKEEESVLFMTLISSKKERIRLLYENLVQTNLHSTRFAALFLKNGSEYCLSLFYRFSSPEEKAQWRESVVHHLG